MNNNCCCSKCKNRCDYCNNNKKRKTILGGLAGGGIGALATHSVPGALIGVVGGSLIGNAL